MVRVVLAGLVVRGGLQLVGVVVRPVLAILLFRRIGLSVCEVFHLVIFARRLGLVALCVVRLLCVILLGDLLFRWMFWRNLV